MYKLDLPVDMKETAAVQRRREMEEERKKRIFNARVRTIGVDVNALEAQAQERARQRALEKQREEAQASDMIQHDKIAQLLQTREEEDKRRLARSLQEFRDRHQRKEDRREWDLYDPEAVRKGKPARVADDDPRLTISGMQKFQGEDLNSPIRAKVQQEQTREWVRQQTTERRRREEQEREADRLHALKMIEADERAMDLAIAEEETRRALLMATKLYNKAQADEMAARRDMERRQEQDDNFTESSNAIHGDMLTENPDVARSAFGPHRVIPDRWKGMSPGQVADIRRIQHEQVLENQRKREAERREAEEWDRRRVAEARCATLLERQEDRARRELNRQKVLENQHLAQEQQLKKEHFDKDVYTNKPSETFFSQFNTSSR